MLRSATLRTVVVNIVFASFCSGANPCQSPIISIFLGRIKLFCNGEGARVSTPLSRPEGCSDPRAMNRVRLVRSGVVVRYCWR
ncbi:hypothetical protein BDQ17DRAFT_1346560 [Cyathus striatus]|nr:hypothetical protein BDQ17DRAFT_1346560 [Cyathus striatus]